MDDDSTVFHFYRDEYLDVPAEKSVSATEMLRRIFVVGILVLIGMILGFAALQH